VWSVQRSYVEDSRPYQLINQSILGVEEELEVDLWPVAQWYLEGDSYSSCIKTYCQKTDRDTFVEE
jgi:hypothetical protein